LIRFGRVLPLFQMIAKNVGIRRARGEFILATNIDILFSDELMARIVQRNFRADRLYRCDRFDVDSTIPKDVPLDEKLRFAWANLIRRNHRLAPWAAPQTKGASLDEVINAALESGHFEAETENGLPVLVAKPTTPLIHLHLNACGDFTLLHRDAWAQIKGYAEFELFSLHLDSLGVATAHLAGFREAWLPPPAVCFHIEHALGSGYTAENQAPMFERIERQGIAWLDFKVIDWLFDEMRDKGAFEFNTDAWGLRDIPLDETVCTRARIEVQKVPEALQADRYAPVTAIKPEFNADRHFRMTAKRFDDERAQFDRWIAETKQRVENAESWAKAADARAENAEAWAKAAEERAEGAELQLGKYRRVFGSLEKLYNKIKFDWLSSSK
jgi:hypothetical protein